MKEGGGDSSGNGGLGTAIVVMADWMVMVASCSRGVGAEAWAEADGCSDEIRAKMG